MLSGFKRTKCMQQSDAQTMAIVFHGSTCIHGNQRVMIILDETMKGKKYKKVSLVLESSSLHYCVKSKIYFERFRIS